MKAKSSRQVKGLDSDHFDYVVIGSGFGGSVAACRLSEKGYRVLVLEQGRRFTVADFPKTNWNLRKWLWVPWLRFFGFFRIRIFRHITVLAGTGVGGGSLVYGNTLPVPRKEYYTSGSWAGLTDWEAELAPYYDQARLMLGAVPNPHLGPGDLALQQLATEIGKADFFEPTRVAVFFGEPEQRVSDPFFSGAGPDREGCRFCGGCMVGCRYQAKNTLDKNYLWLAEKQGAEIRDRSRVVQVRKADRAYRLEVKRTGHMLPFRRFVTAGRIVFSGGVLGTVPLLLKMKRKDFPLLSDRLGYGIRTNNEALIGVISQQKAQDFSEGVAIGSIVHTDPHSHLEPVRYPSGSGFWRLLMAPMISGKTFPVRLFRLFGDFIRHPQANAKAYFVKNWAKRAQILLFMQTLDSSLRIRNGWLGLKTSVEEGKAPSAFIPEAQELARHYARIVDGKALVLPTESLLGIPTTAHILGGACIGPTADEGVIDTWHRVFHYPDLLVTDGSAISANPGVNPSLSIAALAERAMDQIPQKNVLLNDQSK